MAIPLYGEPFVEFDLKPSDLCTAEIRAHALTVECLKDHQRQRAAIAQVGDELVVESPRWPTGKHFDVPRGACVRFASSLPARDLGEVERRLDDRSPAARCGDAAAPRMVDVWLEYRRAKVLGGPGLEVALAIPSLGFRRRVWRAYAIWFCTIKTDEASLELECREDTWHGALHVYARHDELHFPILDAHTDGPSSAADRVETTLALPCGARLRFHAPSPCKTLPNVCEFDEPPEVEGGP